METLFIGQNEIFLPEVNSTNSYAIELLKNVNQAEGTIVYTFNQTQGRGQRGNSWMSQPGQNLAISIVLKPHFLALKNLHFMYVVSALAVHDVMTQILNNSQFDIKIKWPNDILVNGKKIAGILNENILQNTKLNYCVTGIGVNINQSDLSDLPAATSLYLLTSERHDPKIIISKLCSAFEKFYMLLKKEHYSVLLELYYKNLYKINEFSSFKVNDTIVSLKVNGINSSGLLHLTDKDHKDLFFDVKEIQWV